MIYTDLENIYRTRNIENKYALAMIISTRARQLSEQKGRLLGGESSERFITYALEEVLRDDLIIGDYKAARCAPEECGEQTNDASEPNAALDA